MTSRAGLGGRGRSLYVTARGRGKRRRWRWRGVNPFRAALRTGRECPEEAAVPLLDSSGKSWHRRPPRKPRRRVCAQGGEASGGLAQAGGARGGWGGGLPSPPSPTGPVPGGRQVGESRGAWLCAAPGTFALTRFARRRALHDSPLRWGGGHRMQSESKPCFFGGGIIPI